MGRKKMSTVMETVLITGASGGIGAALAGVFAGRGYRLVLAARRTDSLASLSADLHRLYGVPILIRTVDLSRPGEAEALHADLLNEGLAIDILVNNAGAGAFGDFTDIPWETTRDMITLNVTALTCLTRLFLPSMRRRGYGRILNVASTAAFQPGPLMAVYYATKAFVLSFTQALAEENRLTGVTFTALCPGPTRTGFDRAAGLSGFRLENNPLVASPRAVAEYGYRCLLKGKTVAVEGLINRLSVFFVRFIPRPLLLRLVRHVQEAKTRG